VIQYPETPILVLALADFHWTGMAGGTISLINVTAGLQSTTMLSTNWNGTQQIGEDPDGAASLADDYPLFPPIPSRMQVISLTFS